MQIQSPEDLLVNGLQYVYDAEKQLTQNLPKMAQASTTPQLRQAFEQHLKETQGHVQRVEQAFRTLGKQPETKPNTIVQAMGQEVEKMVGMIEASPLRDAALIVAGNQVEHYEMSAYGSLESFAQLLGKQDLAQIFRQTLEEEKKADALLTQVGESQVNPQAAGRSASGAAGR